MKWSNVKLIWSREIRDQMRDRRTLFTIVVLPLLLYPFLGMSMLRVAQFMKEHPTKIWLIGSDALPADPPLLADDEFAANWVSAQDHRLLDLEIDAELPSQIKPQDLRRVAEQHIKAGDYDAVVYFPPDFARQLAEFGRQIQDQDASDNTTPPVSVPEPQIFVNSATDKSRIAHDRLSGVLAAWRQAIVTKHLIASRISPAATEPFQLMDQDVADEGNRRAAIWSKILPFVLLIWALTGAFYPAIDLCAGEKERGTLETLLSSPAEREEIVWGKLLTVMVFSAATALLNILSMSITGAIIVRQITSSAGGEVLQIGAPPVFAVLWLILALLPVSALFSALSLAVAAFARSSKEGQYYLMPLLLITLPLIMLPMFPATELDLGTSLIPLTGIMLLLRSLIEGQFAEALVYAPPVLGMTAVCCMLAIRWAVDQFNNESVLFREGERWGLRLWIRHLVRDRGETPSFGEALLCGVLLLLINFFASLQGSLPAGWGGMMVVILTTQIGLIAAPALLMTVILTRSPRKTLVLSWPRAWTLPGAMMLAVLVHPLVVTFGGYVEHLYPLSPETAELLKPFLAGLQNAPLWQVLLVIAVAPAICEELAFRGFILSGLRHMGHKWAAIALSSVFFGVTHGFLQQSLPACIVGVVIGYIVVQSGSLLPGILFHLTHNSLVVLSSRLDMDAVLNRPELRWIFAGSPGELGVQYSWLAIACAVVAASAVLLAYRNLPYRPYAEESLREVLDHQSQAFT